MKWDDKQIQTWQQKAFSLLTRYDFLSLAKKIKTLELETLKPNFWQTDQAKIIMQDLGEAREDLENAQLLKSLLDELETIIFVISNEDENPAYQEQKNHCLDNLQTVVQRLELKQYLKGKYDANSVIFSVHAGQGGTEAMDWASMLARAYTRYFEKKGYKYQLISESRGEEAGIKAVSYEVKAKYAYGLLKYEAGTHRLVRLSPFNADNLRQTSFALVEVLPLIAAEDKNVVLNEDDLQWHFTRAGGAGGQNVNKVNTAVELTYKPLNLVVRCREERSQEQNKQRALQILRAKIALSQEEARAKELSSLKGTNTQASWGTQIRNFVLHPYQLVKDVRTGVETTDTTAVLEGDFDDFINGALAKLSV